MKTHSVDYPGLLPNMIIGLIEVYPCEMKLSWIKGRNGHCTVFLHLLKELRMRKNKKKIWKTK